MELLILLQAGEGDQVAFAVHGLEGRVVEAVQDDGNRLRQFPQIFGDGSVSVSTCSQSES